MLVPGTEHGAFPGCPSTVGSASGEPEGLTKRNIQKNVKFLDVNIELYITVQFRDVHCTIELVQGVT